MTKRWRIISGILLILAISFLGFARDKYLIYVNNEKVPALNSRTGEERYHMPVTIDDLGSSVSKNPKWVSSVAYSFIYLALSSLCIGLLFSDKRKGLMTAVVHLVLIFIAGMMVLTGLIIHSFHHLYISAEYIKNLIQSPLLTLILITGFMLTRNGR